MLLPYHKDDVEHKDRANHGNQPHLDPHPVLILPAGFYGSFPTDRHRLHLLGLFVGDALSLYQQAVSIDSGWVT